MTRAAIVVLCLAGCLEVPTGPGQECTSSAQCDSGESCTEGLCYGAPPDGMFAATLSAPSSRDDVVATELANLTLTSDGWLGEITLEAPVTLTGRVEAFCATSMQTCTTDSIGAQIRLTRPSRIPGAPAVRFSTQSKPGVARGTDSFTIRVPRTLPSDEPWTVTIDPDGGGDAPAPNGGTDPAELAPPTRFALYATSDLAHQTYTLGSAEPVTITGTLRDAFSNTLSSYRVVALGRWAGESTMTEVSTVDFTADGTYSITIADNVVPPLEIVARPYDPMDVSPTLRLQNIELVSAQKNLSQPTGLGQRREIEVPVQALAGTGEVKDIAGVRVIVTATVESAFSDSLRAEFTTETTTDETGVAHLALLDGPALASNYVVRLVPPASSTYGVVYDGTIDVAKPGPMRLPSRVAVRGTVVDHTGAPLSAVSVTARRSQRFLWSVSPDDQAFLDEIPAATALTPESGEFIVWVDPAVANTWANYDLFFDMPDGALAPSWWLPDVPIERVPNPGTKSLDKVVIPDASRLYAKIVDAGGGKVEGSAVRVFQISSNDNVCMEVAHPPDSCTPATVVLGHGESDDSGRIQLTLPRP